MRDGPRAEHLTDAEFSDLLAGEFPDEGTRFHLASCDYCRDELECVRDSMSSFSGLSTRWANTVAPARVPVPSRWAFRLSAIPSWTTGIAMTAITGLLVFSFGPVGHPHTHPRPAAAVATAAAAPTNTELANDYQLMQSIDQELAYQDQATDTAPTRDIAPHAGHLKSAPVIN